MLDYSHCHIVVGNWVSENFTYLFTGLINAYLVLIVLSLFSIAATHYSTLSCIVHYYWITGVFLMISRQTTTLKNIFRMIYLHTYWIRIANTSGIIARILRRKLVKMTKTVHSHQDKQLLKQWLTGEKAKELHIVMQFMIIVCAWFMFAVKCILVDNICYHISTGHNNTEVIHDMCAFGVQNLEGISLQQLMIPGEETFMWFCEKPVFILCIQVCYKQIGAVQFICILLMITGIEQNPGPTPNSEAIPFTVIGAGKFHQDQTDQFSDHSFGRQCVPNSVAAIAFSKFKHTTKWTSLHMDNILQEGDALYKHTFTS